MERKVIDSFTVGGTKAGPSLPGARLQQMLGTRIEIDMSSRTLYVPTLKGRCTSSRWRANYPL